MDTVNHVVVEPYEVSFPRIGTPGLGYISVAEGSTLPFTIKRVYWTYFTPEDVLRGGHAHFDLEQILIAASGRIEISIELIDGRVFEYILDAPNKGLYIPKLSWRNMKYTHNSVQMCLASDIYREEDYIRSYNEYKGLQSASKR